MKKSKKHNGRPTLYSEALSDKICELLMNGNSLVKICDMEDMPDRTTVCKWLINQEGFFVKYARARELQQELMADEIIDLADQARDKNNADAIRIRVETRKWVMSKLASKRFGDKQTVEMEGGLNLNLTIEKTYVQDKAEPKADGSL